MNENDRNREELIRYLLNYAFDHGYSYRLIKAEPHDPSVSVKRFNYMVINTGWHDINEIPFIISHEIGHLELGEQGVMYYTGYSGSISEEIQADAYALKMLYEYAKSHGHYFYEPIRFMQVYGIPFRMLGLAKKLFEADGRSKYLTY